MKLRTLPDAAAAGSTPAPHPWVALAGPPPSSATGVAGQAAPVGLRAALQARCPALTARELDVCERLLRG